MADNFPEIMTIGETAQYLRISQSSLYKLAQDGRVPCQKVGRHWRFRKQTLEKWFETYPGSDQHHNNRYSTEVQEIKQTGD